MNINPNEKSSQSQNKQILDYLQSGKSITQLEALQKFKCLRLSARIKDLRHRGYAIDDEFITVPSSILWWRCDEQLIRPRLRI